MVEEFEETDEFDVVEVFFHGHFAQRFAVFPDCFVGDAEDVWICQLLVYICLHGTYRCIPIHRS